MYVRGKEYKYEETEEWSLNGYRGGRERRKE